MAHVLFLFLMADFSEIMENISEENGLKEQNFNECLTMIFRREKEL